MRSCHTTKQITRLLVSCLLKCFWARQAYWKIKNGESLFVLFRSMPTWPDLWIKHKWTGMIMTTFRLVDRIQWGATSSWEMFTIISIKLVGKTHNSSWMHSLFSKFQSTTSTYVKYLRSIHAHTLNLYCMLHLNSL